MTTLFLCMWIFFAPVFVMQATDVLSPPATGRQDAAGDDSAVTSGLMQVLQRRQQEAESLRKKPKKKPVKVEKKTRPEGLTIPEMLLYDQLDTIIDEINTLTNYKADLEQKLLQPRRTGTFLGFTFHENDQATEDLLTRTKASLQDAAQRHETILREIISEAAKGDVVRQLQSDDRYRKEIGRTRNDIALITAKSALAQEKSTQAYQQTLALENQGEDIKRLTQLSQTEGTIAEANARTKEAQAKEYAAAQRTRQVKIGVGITGTVAAGITLAHLLYKLYIKRRPRIIEKDDTSIGNSNFPPANLDKQILSKELQPIVEKAFEMYCKNCSLGHPIRNFLFFGPPGTGKTSTAIAFVRKLSELGLADHIIVRGASFKMLKTAGEASAALRHIIRFAQSSSRPTCIVFDEPEELFCDPSLPQATEKTRSLTTDMRSFFPRTTNKKMAFFLCTNYPTLIDKPIMSRISRTSRLEFHEPDLEAVKDLLQQYITENIINYGVVVPESTLRAIPEVSKILHDRGFVGRDIESITYELMQEASMTDGNTLTPKNFVDLATNFSKAVKLRDIDSTHQLTPSPEARPAQSKQRAAAVAAA